MRAVSRLPRARAAGAALAALAAVSAAAGCAATGPHGGQRTHLVDSMANRLAHASELTYTADYRLGDTDATLAQAQKPHQSSFRQPGRFLVVTPEATTDCRGAGAAACTLSPPPSPGVDPTTALFGHLADGGLVTSPTVIGLLTAAALDPRATVEQRQATIAGRSATCVHATGIHDAPAAEFTACITVDGVLGSFSGTVAGRPTDLELVAYRDTVAPDAFALPPGASVRGTTPG
jgi:hypothetical protein